MSDDDRPRWHHLTLLDLAAVVFAIAVSLGAARGVFGADMMRYGFPRASGIVLGLITSDVVLIGVRRVRGRPAPISFVETAAVVYAVVWWSGVGLLLVAVNHERIPFQQEWAAAVFGATFQVYLPVFLATFFTSPIVGVWGLLHSRRKDFGPSACVWLERVCACAIGLVMPIVAIASKLGG